MNKKNNHNGVNNYICPNCGIFNRINEYALKNTEFMCHSCYEPFNLDTWENTGPAMTDEEIERQKQIAESTESIRTSLYRMGQNSSCIVCIIFLMVIYILI
jgi:transposase-like protein